MRWLIAVVPACYAPAPPTGAACTTDPDCPSPQVCDPGTGTCQLSASPSDGGLDTPPPPDAGPDCWAAWKSGAPSLTAPRALTELNSAAREQDPVFSHDGLTLYFTSANTLYRATRPTREAAFGPRQLISELMTDPSLGESRISFSADGMHAVYASRRNDGAGRSDLWKTSLGTNDVLTTPTQTGLESVNDTGDQFDPELTLDGLGMYYTLFPLGSNTGSIRFATRASVTGAFGAGVAIATDLPANTSIFDPSVSPDGLVLVFGRFSGVVGNDLHFATRSSTGQPFTSRGLLATLDDSASQGDSDLSTDGCSIAFASDRAGGQGNRDLWISDVVVTD